MRNHIVTGTALALAALSLSLNASTRVSIRTIGSPRPSVQRVDTGNRQFSVIAYILCRSTNDIKSIPFEKITHINFAFVNPDSLGSFSENPCLDSLTAAAHTHGLKIFASIGGGSAPAYYAKLLQAPQRDLLVANLVKLATERRLDGIDVDLEGERIDANYESFVTQLASALHAAGKSITAAMATVYGATITDKALRQFDYITIMSYDRTGPWRPEIAGPHAPYAMAEEDLEYWGTTRGVPKEKMHLGLPFYGYVFGAPTGASFMRYSQIISAFPDADSKDELPLKNGGTLYYNGKSTIEKKVRLAMQKASGVMFWELSQDAPGDRSLLNAINKVANRH